MDEKSFDIIIVGGGPCGLTAALYAARAGKSVAVIERENIGGQIIYSHRVDNYPALAHISGAEFADRLYEQVKELDAEIISAEVLSVEKDKDCFTITSDSGELKCKALIIASGVVNKKLGVLGEEELVGSGVSYCAVCDGAFYKNGKTVVIGGGDTALKDAIFLSDFCESVTLIHRRDEFRGEASLVKQVKERKNIEIIYSSVVTEFKEKNGALYGLTVLDKKSGSTRELLADGAFIAVGQMPQNEIFTPLVKIDENGFIIAGENTNTSEKGVFAAGDCRVKNVRQLTTAVGDGAVSALEACKYIDDNK